MLGRAINDDPDKPEACDSPRSANCNSIRATDTEFSGHCAPRLEDTGAIEIDRLQDLMAWNAIATKAGSCILHCDIESVCCGIAAGISR